MRNFKFILGRIDYFVNNNLYHLKLQLKIRIFLPILKIKCDSIENMKKFEGSNPKIDKKIVSYLEIPFFYFFNLINPLTL